MPPGAALVEAGIARCAVLYALGFGAEYAAVRVGRAVKYAALWVAGGIRRFAKALAETAFPGAAQVAKDLFGPIVLFAKGIVSLLIHAHRIRREQGFGAAFEASVHYFKNGVRRNLSLLPRMAMYALPSAHWRWAQQCSNMSSTSLCAGRPGQRRNRGLCGE